MAHDARERRIMRKQITQRLQRFERVVMAVERCERMGARGEPRRPEHWLGLVGERRARLRFGAMSITFERLEKDLERDQCSFPHRKRGHRSCDARELTARASTVLKNDARRREKLRSRDRLK